MAETIPEIVRTYREAVYRWGALHELPTSQEYSRAAAMASQAEATLLTFLAERDALRTFLQVERSRVRGVAASGVEFDDPRLDYVVVQVDRDLWDDVRITSESMHTPDEQQSRSE